MLSQNRGAAPQAQQNSESSMINENLMVMSNDGYGSGSNNNQITRQVSGQNFNPNIGNKLPSSERNNDNNVPQIDANLPAVSTNVINNSQTNNNNNNNNNTQVNLTPSIVANPVEHKQLSSANNDNNLEISVSQKIKPLTEELSTLKDDVGGLKGDIGGLKTSMQDLSSTFETALIDLKAFQAEMVNPINFMQKYFDLLDVKNLSDPANTLSNLDRVSNNNNNSNPSTKTEQKKVTMQDSSSRNDTKKHISVKDVDEAPSLEREYTNASTSFSDKTEAVADPHFHPSSLLPSSPTSPIVKMSQQQQQQAQLSIRQMFESGLTPGKIMSIVAMIDEVLATLGPDGIDALVDQYKMLGLRSEDELAIYNVLKMVNESKMLTDDIITMLYRFGRVLGINDKDAELQYARIIAHRRRKPASSREIGGSE